MNRQQALAFFRKHQPLPIATDASLEDQFCAAITFFQQHPGGSVEEVALLLNCWSECGIDGLEGALISALMNYPPEWIAPEVAFGLRSSQSMRRMWFGEVARHFPHHQYVHPLLEILRASENMERFIAACALEPLFDDQVKNAFYEQLRYESDPEIKSVMNSALEIDD